MRNNHRNFNLCLFFPGITDESVLNHFKLEPNSWHHKNMVPALEQLIIVGNICSQKDLGMQITDLKMSLPFAPSTFFGSFLRSREAKHAVTMKKKSRFIPKPTSYEIRLSFLL